MSDRVTVRINTETGAFELFQVDDEAVGRASVDHDASHERVAAELGGLVERRPEIEEVVDGAYARPEPILQPADGEAEESTRRSGRAQRGEG